MSAHSHCDGRRSWNTDRLAEYLKKISVGETSQVGHEILSPEKRLQEALVFGLRMNCGVDILFLEEKFGCALPEDVRQEIEILVDQELLVSQNNYLQATRGGRLLLDEISVKLI